MPLSQAIDGDLGTSWQPRSARAAWIELRLESPASVTAVEIANGFQRKDDLGDLFEMNSRARRIRVEAAGRTFEFDVDPNLRGARRYDLPEAVMTDSVRLTVVGTARGARWDHLAISEIALLTSP